MAILAVNGISSAKMTRNTLSCHLRIMAFVYVDTELRTLLNLNGHPVRTLDIELRASLSTVPAPICPVTERTGTDNTL